jgi:hypothetical protein
MAENMAPELVGGFLSWIVIFCVLALATSIFWLWMLIDVLLNEPTTEEKTLWFLVVFFLHFVGAVVYLIVRRKDRPAARTGRT